MIPSLRIYLIVSQQRRSVAVYRREGDGAPWRHEMFTEGLIPLPELGTLELSVDAIYARTRVGEVRESAPRYGSITVPLVGSDLDALEALAAGSEYSAGEIAQGAIVRMLNDAASGA